MPNQERVWLTDKATFEINIHANKTIDGKPVTIETQFRDLTTCVVWDLKFGWAEQEVTIFIAPEQVDEIIDKIHKAYAAYKQLPALEIKGAEE